MNDDRTAVCSDILSSETEITLEMIAAGTRAIREFDPRDWADGWLSPEKTVRAVLEAVAEAQ